MATDAQGLPISPATPGQAAGIHAFADGFLSYRTHMVDALPAAEAEPGHPLLDAMAAALHMFAEAPGAEALARPFLARARAAGGSARERAWVASVGAWVEGDPARAAMLAEAGLREHPADLALAKLAQYHFFNRGDLPGLLRAALPGLAARPEEGWAHGMAAFGFEQAHRLEEAEAHARHALELRDGVEPWASHALAHVRLTRGQCEPGADELSEAAPRWRDLNSFAHTHLHWHLALFRIARGRLDEALALYDREVWGRDPAYSQDQAGAVALLARIELAGGEVGGRWQALRPWLASRQADVTLPFLALHYLLGLARAGAMDEAGALMAAIARQGGPAWAQAARPAGQAIMARARGDWRLAAELMVEAWPHALLVGGSHAQRDLFEQLLIDSLARAGRRAEAMALVEARRARDPAEWTAQVLGERAQAGAAAT
jgi:hypothetical protein